MDKRRYSILNSNSNPIGGLTNLQADHAQILRCSPTKALTSLDLYEKTMARIPFGGTCFVLRVEDAED